MRPSPLPHDGGIHGVGLSCSLSRLRGARSGVPQFRDRAARVPGSETRALIRLVLRRPVARRRNSASGQSSPLYSRGPLLIGVLALFRARNRYFQAATGG